ncbi:MAG: hypothetical protein R3261_14110 [Alphaproteobacteria bacterium]|nr:hypothetical protein [Alphaproteobacteria bacterium]
MTRPDLHEITVLFVNDNVALEDKDIYENNVKELHGLLNDAPGFISVDVISKQQDDSCLYSILLRFNDKVSLTNWLDKSNVQSLISTIKSISKNKTEIIKSNGYELWALDTDSSATRPKPPFWKRISVGVIAVYPMLMLLLTYVLPHISNLPNFVQVFLIVFVMTILVELAIMPLLKKLLNV